MITTMTDSKILFNHKISVFLPAINNRFPINSKMGFPTRTIPDTRKQAPAPAR